MCKQQRANQLLEEPDWTGLFKCVEMQMKFCRNCEEQSEEQREEEQKRQKNRERSRCFNVQVTLKLR